MSVHSRPLGQKFTEVERQKINEVISGRTDQNPDVIEFGDSEVSTQANRTNELSEIIDIQVPSGMIYVFPANFPVAMYLATHETLKTSGNTNVVSYSLANDFVDSPTVTQVTAGSGVSVRTTATPTGQMDLVLFGTTGATTGSSEQIVPANVDYTNNSFSYQQSASDNDYLEAYYLFGDPSQIVGRAYDQSLENFELVFGATARELHLANVFNREEQITFRNNFALNEKEHLKFLINTSVDMTNWDATGTSGPRGSEAFPYFRLPAFKLNKEETPGRARGRGVSGGMQG